MVAAYAVIWFILLVYVVVLASRTARITREVELLARVAERESPEDRVPAEADPVAAPGREGAGE